METGEVLVIDLFAGPGGLGEGVSSVTHENGNLPFKIGVSVEKEPSAHKTLTTRAFYRKIQDAENGLASYNAYLDGDLTREELFERFPQQAEEAQQETLLTPHALGDDNEEIHQRIRYLVEEHGNDRPRIVIGGPPCQAYSLAGRSRNAGIEGYTAEKDHRNFLYKEYLKVLSIAQPDVFIMENVRGILSAKIGGEVMFPRILKDLRAPGRITKIATPRYKVFSLVVDTENVNNPSYDDPTDFLIKAENYGVPQARHRVILLGVRADVEGVPGTLARGEEQTTVEQVLADLPKLRSGFSKRKDEVKEWERAVSKNGTQVKNLLKPQFENIKEIDLKPFKNLPRSASQPVNQPTQMPSHLVQWYRSNTPACVLNHETRGHMESDLLRYAFSAAYTKLSGGTSPKARDFPDALAPEHENWKSGAHADRFRTQAANKCSTTVTSHISKDGHYFIHYDPKQCRSLTVREVARLQTFPDNYLFEGTRTQQYVQVGNAVPPYLAKQIGQVVMDLLEP
ncbi:DNA (cytosine-5-)-methyltransferase [Vibrio splendidus]|uniref:DNA cytosine methyltransferase n=1 Tax=Vibrio splendidus TaxID=29497 RepID=UPI000D37C04C|nr:DNA cytosine methyltransferase [Vibrio splendidus]PTO99951.1 DNA (cytosine-5-)-methyltransferase [Vibrio splendidus]